MIRSLVTFEENSLLTKVSDGAKIRSIVLEMDGSSAPGPDGFISDFFNYC